MRRTQTAPSDGAWRRCLCALLVLVAGVVAYHNSLGGPFLFDDQFRIIENARIRHLWPLSTLLAGSLRPVVDLSLAINYALGGLDVRGYHLVNLAIHLSAALCLFGIVRRTLSLPRMSARLGDAALWLSTCVAILWVVHPLQTQSVTYTIQRAESLAGLWHLLTLYSVIRGEGSRRASGWHALAVLACALGMATKPVMVTAPLLVLLYDRTFLSGSVGEALRRSRGLYAGLAATWLVLGVVLASPELAQLSAGFHLRTRTPLEYAGSQPGVILHYLRLAFWPHPLVFDYDWPVAHGAAIARPAFLVGVALLAAGWMLRRAPAVGFLGAAFCLLLAPSSSVIPIRDLAMEHRMYLPLAPLMILAVIGAHAGLRRRPSSPALRRAIGAVLMVAITIACARLTIRRNADYASEEAMWQDTVQKRPANPRAHTNLGAVLAAQGRIDDAIAHYQETLRLDDAYAEAHSNLAAALAGRGRLAEAGAHYQTALQLWPDDAKAHVGLGVVLSTQGRRSEAMRHYQDALRLDPQSAEAHNNLGVALVEEGQVDEAIAHYLDALRLRPDYAKARNNLEEARALRRSHLSVEPH